MKGRAKQPETIELRRLSIPVWRDRARMESLYEHPRIASYAELGTRYEDGGEVAGDAELLNAKEDV